jgi:GTPase
MSTEWAGKSITNEQLDTILSTIPTIAEEVGVKACVLYTATDHDRPRAAVLLRLPPTSVSSTPEVRCAVVGNVDSGKSTTLGVLTRGGLDDGRGRARVGLFRHKHEIETGRTSSVGMEVGCYMLAQIKSLNCSRFLASMQLARLSSHRLRI